MGNITITIFVLKNSAKALYITEVMSYCRKNRDGITFKLNEKRINTVLSYILMYRDLNELLDFKFNKIFMLPDLKIYIELTLLYIKNKNYDKAILHQRSCNKYVLGSNLKLV